MVLLLNFHPLSVHRYALKLSADCQPCLEAIEEIVNHILAGSWNSCLKPSSRRSWHPSDAKQCHKSHESTMKSKNDWTQIPSIMNCYREKESLFYRNSSHSGMNMKITQRKIEMNMRYSYSEFDPMASNGKLFNEMRKGCTSNRISSLGICEHRTVSIGSWRPGPRRGSGLDGDAKSRKWKFIIHFRSVFDRYCTFGLLVTFWGISDHMATSFSQSETRKLTRAVQIDHIGVKTWLDDHHSFGARISQTYSCFSVVMTDDESVLRTARWCHFMLNWRISRVLGCIIPVVPCHSKAFQKRWPCANESFMSHWRFIPMMDVSPITQRPINLKTADCQVRTMRVILLDSKTNKVAFNWPGDFERLGQIVSVQVAVARASMDFGPFVPVIWHFKPPRLRMVTVLPDRAWQNRVVSRNDAHALEIVAKPGVHLLLGTEIWTAILKIKCKPRLVTRPRAATRARAYNAQVVEAAA